MEELLAELADEFGPGKLFGPIAMYGSVRTKAYKTNCAATLGQGVMDRPTCRSRPMGLSVGGGLYMPDAATLQRYRTAVDREKSGAELADIVSGLHAGGYRRPSLTRCSRPRRRATRKDHPRIELLRHKGIAMMKDWPVGAWPAPPSHQDRVVATLCGREYPSTEWLQRYVA